MEFLVLRLNSDQTSENLRVGTSRQTSESLDLEEGDYVLEMGFSLGNSLLPAFVSEVPVMKTICHPLDLRISATLTGENEPPQ